MLTPKALRVALVAQLVGARPSVQKNSVARVKECEVPRSIPLDTTSLFHLLFKHPSNGALMELGGGGGGGGV